ncbi:MAG: response regulator [Planctomycetes bacterium]|nr:response regulator [Planctomycetota bacterium]
MSTIDAGAIADSAVRLGLLGPHQAEEAWAELPSRKAPAEDFLRFMESRGYLTPFQSSKLLKGDNDGYILGGYRMLYKIASGSFGRVYRASDPSTGQVVAIKVLRNKWSKDPRKIDMFTREAKVGMSLRHPNVVEILAVNHEKTTNQHYIVMEFVEGGNLRDFLKSRKKLEVSEVLRILEDVASGLAYAFSRGVTHRDMKLTNILLSSQGPAKLVDFGLAGGQFNVTGDENQAEVYVDRTVDYAGLELVSNVEQGDKRSDIFFVGCAAYELLSGRSPLEYSRSAQARMSAQRFHKILSLSPEEVSAPTSVFRLVENMMDLEPESRIQTPAQLLERIRICRAELANKAGSGSHQRPQATLFIAEHDEKLQNVLRTKLKEEGFRVLLAADPVRALDRFRQQPFDVLIVDAATTGENGYFVFERIMEDAARQNVLIHGILLVNPEQLEWKDRLTEYKNAVVLVQPVKYKQLLHTIRGVLAGQPVEE